MKQKFNIGDKVLPLKRGRVLFALDVTISNNKDAKITDIVKDTKKNRFIYRINSLWFWSYELYKTK